MKNRLRELRAVKEWSQADLADQLGVSRQTVNAIETEKYDPSLPLAFKVARLFEQFAPYAVSLQVGRLDIGTKLPREIGLAGAWIAVKQQQKGLGGV